DVAVVSACSRFINVPAGAAGRHGGGQRGLGNVGQQIRNSGCPAGFRRRSGCRTHYSAAAPLEFRKTEVRAGRGARLARVHYKINFKETSHEENAMEACVSDAGM